MDIKVDSQTVVAFDLDDTLYNELEYLKSAYRNIARSLDKENWRELYVYMFSLFRSKQDVFEHVSKTYDTEKSVLIDSYRNHQPEIELFSGVLAFFETVKLHHGRLGIITDGREVQQTVKLKALGLEDYIDAVVISETMGTEKPNEANYREIERLLKGRTYYYFGDNLKKDFITAKHLNWTTICLIDNGLNVHYQGSDYIKSEYSPDYYIESFTEINVI